jgi:hypothetical protein
MQFKSVKKYFIKFKIHIKKIKNINYLFFIKYKKKCILNCIEGF